MKVARTEHSAMVMNDSDARSVDGSAWTNGAIQGRAWAPALVPSGVDAAQMVK